MPNASSSSTHRIPLSPSSRFGVQLKKAECGLDILITLGEQNVFIHLSHAFYSAPTLLEWLQAVSTNDFPIGFEIDEEGTAKALFAYEFDGDRLFLAIFDPYAERVCCMGVVEHYAFLAEWRKMLTEFLRDSRRSEVELTDSEHMDNIRRYDVPYLAELKDHPFLTISDGSQD